MKRCRCLANASVNGKVSLVRPSTKASREDKSEALQMLRQCWQDREDEWVIDGGHEYMVG